jgi:hypothetical protein
MRLILLQSPAFGRDLRQWRKSHHDTSASIEATLEELSADALRNLRPCRGLVNLCFDKLLHHDDDQTTMARFRMALCAAMSIGVLNRPNSSSLRHVLDVHCSAYHCFGHDSMAA